MASVFLEPGDNFTLASGAKVYGSTGSEKVIVNTGVTGVVLDQNVERVDLAGDFSTFTYQQAGNQLKVFSGTTLVATIPLQGDADGTQIVTTAGSVVAKLSGGVMTLGGTDVPSAAAGVVAPATVDAGVTTGATLPPTLPTFSIAGPGSVIEGGSAEYTVSLSAPQGSATTVNFATALGGGASSTDLGTVTVTGTGVTTAGSTLTFAAGATSAKITVPVPFDGLTETGETVALTLSNPSTGMVLGTSSVTTALQDPGPTTYTMVSDATAGTSTQEGKTLTFTITPASTVPTDTTMTLNLTGTTLGAITKQADAADFSPSSATVTFKAGDTGPKVTTVTVVADGSTEGTEAYQAQLLDTSYAALATTTGTITDALPSLVLTQDKSAVDEGGSVVYTVTSDMTAPTGGISVPYTLAGTATTGTDYTGGTATGGTITIAAGSKTGSLILNTVADNATESLETMKVTLGSPSFGTVVSPGYVETTINDTSKALGAAEIALTGAATVDEGGDLVYTVTRGSAVATGSTLTIPYALTGEATNGTDYTGSAATGNLVMAAGASSASLTLKVTADSLTEATAENIIMTLGTLPAGTTVAAGRPSTITTAVNDTSKTVLGDTGTLTTLATDSVLNKTIVNGVLDTVAPATNRTWHVSDTISGTAAASDALNAIVLGNTANATTDSYAGLTTTLIENFNFRYIDNNDSATATGATIDASGLSGAAKLAVSGSTINGTTNSDTFTITNAVATAAAEVSNNSSLLNVKFDNAGTASTADSMKLVTSGGSTGTVTLDDVVNNGFVTVNVTTETAASTLKGLDAGSTFTTLNVSGNQGLTITNALPTTVTIINAGANSGAVKLTTNSSTLTATGGTGTADVLTLNTIPTGTISGFETVVAGAANSTLSLATVTGATKLGVATGLTSAAFTNAAATTNTIHLSGSYQPNGAALTTSTSLTTGTLAYTPVSATTVATDTLTIAVDNGGTANTGTYTAGNIAANQIESLTLTTADWTNVTTGTITQTVASTVAGSFTASGAANLTLGTVNITGGLDTTTDTYNFGGVAGTLNTTIGDTGNASVTGAAGADTLTTTSMGDTATVFTQTFNLGTGDDNITFVSGTTAGVNEVVLTGAGVDKLILNGEAGNDKFSYTAIAAANTDLVTIAGGLGTDTLYISSAAANGPTATVSGVEAITFADTTADVTTILTWAAGATDIVTITDVSTKVQTLNITTVAGSGVLNTSNWSWLGWAAADKFSVTGDTGNDVLTGTIGLDTIIGGSGNDTIVGGDAVDVITGGEGADTINLTESAAAADVVVFATGDTGITVATADAITGFATTSDQLKTGVAGVATGTAATTENYTEAVAVVADFAAALAAANIALAATNVAETTATIGYDFQWDATNGYLFIDRDSSGTADEVVVLVGITDAGIAAGDMIA
ncbi:beta strand repeat-containing protein [Thiospirillum jenense]|uniref:Calx-beta domain-containing protein n=1 Tax=Thiospirillum jenense TaxID=1653858 RepID=A0A839HEW7_9GAMM|nr:Calx-beta domain-containing protein [Thiospirillum jenense]MBB1125936.1 hypothetical protein [Thiospirillum jenense]